MDTWLDLNPINLLGRVDSRINKEKLVKDIAKHFRIGNVISFRQIHEGFEDYNIKLKTTKGVFLLKLFSQYKSFRHVKDNVLGLVEFEKAGVKVPKLYKNHKGEYLYYYEKEGVMALGCLMEYFKGRSYFKTGKEPELSEITNIVGEIVKINSVEFKPLGIYDTWVVQNLIVEYEKKKRFLSKRDLKLIKPIVKRIKSIDYSKCTKGTIHGDIQRSNILKSRSGNFRIIDFSVMEYHAVAIELAIFLALFCIDPKKTKRSGLISVYKKVLSEYVKGKSLYAYDLEVLPDLMSGTYAINCLAASYEKYGKKNDSEETQYWLDLGNEGMKQMKDVMKDLRKIRF